MTLEKLQKDIEEIKARNKRVDLDKAWETSWTRRALILLLTYVVVVLFFIFAGLADAFVNAIVPSLGFFLSTLTISVAKKMWMKTMVH